MSTFKTYAIQPLASSDPADSDAAVSLIDSRFETTENALNDLSGRIETLSTKSAIIRQNVPLASGVYAGALVYYDKDNAQFDLAQALTLAETGASGQTIEAPQARVEGMILSTNTGSDGFTGTMLCGGYWEDLALANTCLGQNAEPGIYYLSPVIAGQATQTTYGHLRQPVLSYYGGGKFSMSIFYMAHDNHFHSSQVLTGTWVKLSGSTIQDGYGNIVDIPDDAQYVYGGTYSYGIGAIGDTTALFYNGVLQTTGSDKPFYIAENNIWYMNSDQPESGKAVIFNHYPFAYDTAVVRSVTSTNDALTVKNTNGLITITANDFVQGAVEKSSYAIASINGKSLNYTPVITDVVAGPGINVSKALDGSTYISAANRIGGLLDAYSINHNGTTLISNGSLQYITFPANRISNFVMVMPVSDITTPCSLSVWGIKLGTTAANLNVIAYYIPDPTVGNASTIDVSRESAVLQIGTGDDADTLTYGEALISGCTVSGNGLLVASVSVSSEPSSQIQLLRTGFKLGVINNNVTPTTDDSNAITQTMQVGDTAITAGSAVMISNGMLATCTNTKNGLNDTTNKCVGIAMTNAAAGSMLTYMITGTMTLVVEDATPGQSLYIDADGSLTPVTDTDTFMGTVRYLQKVGTVLTGNKIQVNIESAVKGHI